MTRKELIAHYKWVVNSVFKAEDAIRDKWFPRLRAANSLTPEEREKLADAYIEAVATEIVSKTSDEEIAKLED